MSNTDVWENSLEKFNHIANRALFLYDILSQSTVELLNYSENATYLARNSQTGEKHILRVSRPGYHTKAEIESELVWLTSIDEHSSIEVSLPILGNNGQFIQTIKLENYEYYFTLFTFLEGDAPNEDNETELIRQFEDLGEITAHLHENSIKYGKDFQEIKRPVWNYDTILGEKPKWGRWQDGLAITPERADFFQKVSDRIQERLDRLGSEPNRFGLIHSDLRLANLLVEGERIRVIDFDDCGFGWYLYDLATSLSFIEHKPYVPELIRAWLKGYRKVRYLSEEEGQEIPTFIMMRRLQLISWIGSRDNETTQELGGEYTEQTDDLAKKYLGNLEV